MGILAVLATGLYLYFRAGQGQFVWREFLSAMARVRGPWLAASIAAILLGYLVRALRWEVLLRPLTRDVYLWDLFVATCIGFTAVVLFGRAGEAVRPYLISRKASVAFTSQVAAWLVERILDTMMVLLIFGIALTQVENSGLTPGPRTRVVIEAGGWLAGLTGGACLAVLAGLRWFRGQARQRLLDALGFLPDAALERIRNFLHAFDQGMQSTRDRWFLRLLVLYTILEWAVITAAFVFVIRAFPVLDALRFTDAIILLGFVAFGGVLQIPGLGGGTQIATVLVLTELYNVGLEAASGVALILWIVGFLVVVPVGLGFAFHEGIKWRNMKQVGEDLEV